MSEMQDLLYWLHDCKKSEEELDKVAAHSQRDYHMVAAATLSHTIWHIEKRMGHVLASEGMRKLYGWD